MEQQIEDLYELSPMQQGMLFHTLYAPGSGIYCEQLATALHGDLDPAAFERAWAQVAARHPVLRTAFHWEELEKPLQVVHREVEIPWERGDWRNLSEAAAEAELERYLAADRQRGFELGKAPLLRLALFRTAERSYRFVFSFHHILMDGWCLPLVIGEVLSLYAAGLRGETARLPRPRRYCDFITWLQQRDEAGDEAFWRGQLAGFRAPTPLPAERPGLAPGAPAEATEAYAECAASLTAEESAALQGLARSRQITVNTLFQGAWALLLSRLSGERGVLFGATVSGRPAALPGVEQIVGVFINTLPVRVDVPPGAPLLPWLEELQSRQAEAREREHTPLARIQSWSDVPPGQPLFESILVFENQPVETSPSPVPGAARGPQTFGLADVRVVERTNYPLTLVVVPGSPLRLRAVYERRRLDPAGVERLLGHLRTLLAAMAATSGDPERQLADLPLLTAEERRQILGWGEAAEPADGGVCLHQTFEARAAQTPEAVAAVCAGASLTYRELSRRANRLAHHLIGLGVGPDVLVGLCLERSLDLVVAVLGVLKAGGAYLPIDPVYPPERIAYLLEDSRAPVLITADGAPGGLPPHGARVVALASLAALEGGREDDPRVPLSPDNLAYSIYTSGSTGKPKGVLVTHRNVARLFAATEPWFGFGEADVWTLFHSYSFDFSVWELWGALLYGGRLVVVPHWTSRSPEAFHELLRDERVTVLNQTPSAFRQLVRADVAHGAQGDPASLSSLRWVVFGGEAVDLPSLAPWFDLHGDERPRLVNMYGITETTVHVTYRPLSQADLALAAGPIGPAIPDLRMRVLDPRLEPVPAGVAGEMYVGGAGLARGYLGRPELTAERFVPDPFAGVPGARLYRTGDLARWRPLADNGADLDYLGRIDHQVKVRGFRIELGEIEASLAEHPAVAEAVVLAREDAGTDRRLVAYVVPRGETERPAVEALRSFLKTRLPDHMIPAAFVVLDRLPLTAHGKVDRRALPAPGAERPEMAQGFTAPADDTERALAEVWAEALGLDRVGVDDNFFALGGDSIRSVRVLALARERGVEIPLEMLFRLQTVRELAAELRQGDGTAAAPRAHAAPFSLIPEEDRARLPEDAEDAYPLALLQGGMLFHNDLSPEAGLYHNVTSFLVRAALDADSLRAAVREQMARHPLLRTSFDLHSFSEPLQLVHRASRLSPIVEVSDLRGLAPDEQEAAFSEWFEAEKQRRFDWTQAPLFRFHVHRRTDEAFTLSLTEHHAILDGWSVAVLLTEMFQSYLFLLGRTDSPLPAPPSGSFRDFVALEREALASEAARRYWHSILEDGDPCALPRWRGKNGTAGAPGAASAEIRQHEVPLAPEIGEGLDALARRAGVPLKSLFLAVHLRVLGLLTGRGDVTTGVVSDGRPEEVDGERVLGLFVNTLPFRLAFPAGSWLDLVRATFDAERSLLPHRRFPLAELQRMGGGERLYEAVFNYVHFHVYRSLEGLSGVQVLDMKAFQVTDFVLITNFGRDTNSSRVGLSIEYGTAHLRPEQVEAIGGYYARALEALLADPDAPHGTAPLLSAAERHQILTDWNDSASELPRASVVELFAEQAARRPEAVAATSPDGRWTYAELDRRADALARTLRDAGAGPEVLVAVLAPRGLDYLAALLAIWKTGAAYLPLDPGHPAQRQAQVLARSRTALVLHAPDLSASLDEALALLPEALPRKLALAADRDPAAAPLPRIETHGLSYVIFTSGSTGTPKGAMVEPRGMLNHLLAKITDLGLTAADVVVQNASQSFDISIWQFIAALLVGGRVHVVPDEIAHDPARLLAEVADESVTILEIVPSLLAVLLDEAALREAGAPELPALRWLIPTGEALPPELCRRWLGLYPRVPLLNAYGPTECSDDITHHLLPEPPEKELRVPIGRPVLNLSLYAVDRELSPLPLGVAGELCAGGIAVGRGYLGEPARTAEVFVPDPFAAEPGARLYRTGDLGRRLPDGAIEFLGRLDHQVKIRGFRVELGEIESALTAHPTVRQAAVVTTPAGSLAAFVVAREGQALDSNSLQRFLAASLPDYMVPAVLVPMAALPLTVNGKVDRRALPVPEEAGGGPARDFAAPRTPVEEVVAGIWADVLGRPRLGIHDDFFDLGGHSLLATRIVSWIRNTLKVDLPLRALFDTPTVAGLAGVVEAAMRSGGGFAEPPIEPRPAGLSGEDLPLSFAQQRLWFLDQLVPGNPFYNVPADVRVRGLLDVPALMASLGEVVRRHEALRTTFPAAAGRPIQVVAPPAPVPLPVADLSGLDREAREAESWRLTTEEARRPFDLARGPLLRAALVRLAPDDHALLATLHHIVADGWSGGILRRELGALYRFFEARSFEEGRPSPLPELPIQYPDYARWQRSWFQGEVLDAQLGYWKERLADPPALDLPTDRPRPAIGSFRGDERWRHLSPELAAGLQALARRRGATLFMGLLAAFDALLSRYTGQDDLLIGTPIANRNRSEIEGLIGFFVNTLALRGDTSGDPGFLTLIDRAREVTLGAYAHQDLPFEKLIEELHPERDTSRNPLFQVLFVLQNFPAPAVELPGLAMRPLEVGHGTAKFDLQLFLAEHGGGLAAAFEYSTDLYDGPTLDRMLAHLQTLIEGAVTEPDRPLHELPLLDGEETRQALAWNGNASASRPSQPDACLHRIFEARAEAAPNTTAVVHQTDSLTYGELNARANRLARRLRSLGVGAETPVALCLERSPEMVVAILAVLKAGGAYVPLDPAYPADRLAFALADSRAAVLVTERALVERTETAQGPRLLVLDETDLSGESAENLEGGAFPESLAYVIYTSGSTGRPKGVLVPHANAVRLFRETEAWFGFTERDVWTLFHSYAFDFSVWEIWGALLYGGRLVVVPYLVSRSPQDFHQLVKWEGVTVLNQTPSAFRQFVQADLTTGDPEETSLRWVIFGGEALDLPSLEPWTARHGARRPRLANMYGITETTVHVTYRPLTPADVAALDRWRGSSPIGVPIPDLAFYVLDRRGRPVPLGVPGEIQVGGNGLARGYLDRPGLTAERFVPDPFSPVPGARLYRTGDLARFRPDGEVEYLGRIDHQVKIRGFRIELGEIETVLAQVPAVRESAVVVYEGAAQDSEEPEAEGPRLVAYVVQDTEPVPVEGAGSDGSDTDSTSEQVEQWRTVFDGTYGRTEPETGVDPAFDITGWDSSYTGQPIPAEEMAEWVEGTVARILAERPARVLEIGCGTGLLLSRVAPHTQRYLATDFSAVALAKVRRLAAGSLPHVELRQRSADDFSGIEAASFDAIVINSVAQYFPSLGYLLSVLDGAVRSLAPGGVLFVGDIRSLPLLETFHASVEMHQAGTALSAGQLHQRVRRSVAREEELVIDPAFFPALRHRYSEIGQIEVQLRRGRFHNELTRFRYDALLRARPEPAERSVPRLSWGEDLSLAGLAEQLEREQPEALEVAGIPNARLAGEAEALDLLAADGSSPTVDALRRELAGVSPGNAVDPEALWELGRRLPYAVAVAGSAAGGGLMDVRFTRLRRGGGAGAPPAISFPAAESKPRPWPSYANNPLAGRFARRFVPRLRGHLEARLPEHMLPSAFVLLDALPLTPNGKLDRRALPAPDFARPELRQAFVAPKGQAEAALASIWADVLGVERVGGQDNFFELGGHSLLATQVISRVRTTLAVELPLRALFEEPTLAGLAERIERTRQEGPAVTLQPLPSIEAVPHDGPLPLSFAQQRLWFLDDMAPGRPDYNIAFGVRLAGPLDGAALGAAIGEIVRRHAVLRTTFTVIDGAAAQVIGPAPGDFLALVDLTGLASEEERRAESRRLALAEARRPFDLRRGPLLRATLLRLAAEEHVALLTLHHIVSDGWSVGVLVAEVAALYNAAADRRPSPLPELPLQYADYAVWQRRWLDGAPLEAQLAYWQRQLAGLPVLHLPTDRPRPPVQTSHGRHQPFALPGALSRELRALSERENATLFMTLLAGFAALLHHESGQADVVVGTDVANRNRGEIEGLIGFFVNQLVLRVDLAGDPSFRTLLGRARETALGAYTHQDLPFERLVAALQAERDLSRTPLFQAKFVLQNAPGGALDLPGLQLGLLPIDNQTAKFDLLLDMTDTDAGLVGEMEYNTDLFEAATIDRLVARLESILRLAAAQPDARLSEILAALVREEAEAAAQREQALKESRQDKLRKVERRAVRGVSGR